MELLEQIWEVEECGWRHRAGFSLVELFLGRVGVYWLDLQGQGRP